MTDRIQTAITTARDYTASWREMQAAAATLADLVQEMRTMRC